MKITLILPHHDSVFTVLHGKSHFSCAQQLNGLGHTVDAITCSIDIDKLNEQSVDLILPTLRALLDLLVNDLVSSIKEKNHKKLLATTLQLRALISYCNDLSRVLEPNADDDNPSKLLALVKAKKIDQAYTVFPKTEDDVTSRLNYNDALWFTTQYAYLTFLKNSEYKLIREKCSEQEIPLPRPAQLFMEAYSLMTQFIILEGYSYLSEAIPDKELTRPYTYEKFCLLSQDQETVEERILNRKYKKLIHEFEQLISDSAEPASKLATLNNIYEIIKTTPECDRNQIFEDLNLRADFDINKLNIIIFEIRTSFPDQDSFGQPSTLTQAYLSELNQALNFCERIIQCIDRVDISNARCVIPLIHQSIQTNIDSLEVLNTGLLSYQLASKRKAPRNAVIVEHTPDHTHDSANSSIAERSIATTGLSAAVNRLPVVNLDTHDEHNSIQTDRRLSRVELAEKLIEVSNNSDISVKQRVCDIQTHLEDNKENIEDSGWNLLKKCWNFLKRIGNAVKGVYHYQDEVARTAHFEKARNPKISADKLKLTSRFFQGARVFGIRSENHAVHTMRRD